MQFIARLEFELDYLGSTHKQASLEIFKLDLARLDYIPRYIIRLICLKEEMSHFTAKILFCFI